MTWSDRIEPTDAVLRDLLRDALVVEPSDTLAERHVDAALREWTPAGAIRPSAAARRPSRRPTRSLRSPVMVRAVVVAVVTSLSMTIGLAEAGALPGPVQQVVVDVGHFAGIDFPTTENSSAPAAHATHSAPTFHDEPAARAPEVHVSPRAAALQPNHHPLATVARAQSTSSAVTVVRANPPVAHGGTDHPAPPVVTHPAPPIIKPRPPTDPGPPPPVTGGNRHGHHPRHGHHRRHQHHRHRRHHPRPHGGTRYPPNGS